MQEKIWAHHYYQIEVNKIINYSDLNPVVLSVSIMLDSKIIKDAFGKKCYFLSDNKIPDIINN